MYKQRLLSLSSSETAFDRLLNEALNSAEFFSVAFCLQTFEKIKTRSSLPPNRVSMDHARIRVGRFKIERFILRVERGRVDYFAKIFRFFVLKFSFFDFFQNKALFFFFFF